MALTRRFLEGMGIEEKQVESIIEAHSETVNGLKAQRDKALEEAKKLPDLQKQLEEAKAANEGTDDWQRKYEAEHKALEDFRAKVSAEKADADKAKAYRGMLVKAGIDQRRIDSIMRVTDLSEISMKDGKLEDADKLEESAKKEWADFVVRKVTEKANPAEPPKASRLPEGADPDVERRMRERNDRMFGKTEKE